MTDYEITLVPEGHIMEAWPLAEPHLVRAAEYTYGRYDALDILDLLLNDHHQLWLTFNDQGIDGALVTVIKQYPKKRMLDLCFIGGDDGMAWKDKMLDILRRWAYDNSCDGIEACARLGWSKIFKADGYTPLWQKFELPVGEEGLGGGNG